MKKILPIALVVILVLSGFGAVAVNNDRPSEENHEVNSDSITLTFSQPTIKQYDSEYMEVNFEGVSTYLTNPGQPILPDIVKSIELPFGVKNVNVEVTPNNVQEYEIYQEIRPAPAHVLLTNTENSYASTSVKDEKLYASDKPFPSNWYSYRVSCGLNANNERVTFVSIHMYPVRYTPALKKLYVAESADIKISYDSADSNPFPMFTTYNMVIIAPSKFSFALQKLINHKNSKGVKTFLKTTEDIYKEYSGIGIDKPEKIKYFIKDAIETYNITYVLLVGGVKSSFNSKPRDDPNQGTRDWFVPVRYNNFYDNPAHPLQDEGLQDPGVISDLYYADIYNKTGDFENWDPNGDGIIAAWGMHGVENDTDIDMCPDVSLGRLACTSLREVRDVVNKIIRYEKSPADPDWFKKVVVVSGDGFLDQNDLNIEWNTTYLPDGEYTIKAQSKNPDGVLGPTDEIHITLDRTKQTSLTFNHDDNLITGLKYPFKPVAEIVSVSNGNILGNTNYNYTPDKDYEAFCNDFYGWANVNYTDGILHIRGKTYDPKPYGNVTDIHVWVENKDQEIVFEHWVNNSEMYYEGEWITGYRELKGAGGALSYMPSDFKNVTLWTSNGKLTGVKDVIPELSKGCGFAFMSGHGSPNVWADHYPGIPGNRQKGSVTGLWVLGINAWRPFVIFPVLPMNKLKNIDKLPVFLVGGCHNSQFNISMIETIKDMGGKNERKTWTYGTPVAECFSWYLVKLPYTGAIATIGNTGLGYGSLGDVCTIDGLDGGICIEFFKQYGTNGHHVLGDAYTQTLRTYVETYNMGILDHAKSLTQWALLGDPSLMIGGYS